MWEFSRTISTRVFVAINANCPRGNRGGCKVKNEMYKIGFGYR